MLGSFRQYYVTFAAGLLLVAMAVSASAQGVTGTVSGTVKDVQGGVIPGATVTLISEARGTRTAPVITNATGDFVFPNLTADTYTIQVEMPSFKTLKRSGVAVSPGSRIVVGTFTIEVGGATEVVNVKGEAPMIQAASGERSFSVSPESVAALPLLNRSYDGLLALAPGVAVNAGALTPATRLGGGGDGNFMLDGVTTMDPGVNRPASRVSVEAVSEVKVVTSTYQAEYGRSSGLQINAVTKGGTNQFHGSLYDVERKSAWNANSRTNILNGDPKTFAEERDWGYAIGGPIGKPGGSNKLFFYYNQEFNPRTQGNNVVNYRMPTALERKGDFSQSTDNLGNPYPYIKDPSLAGTCSSASQVACFADGGVPGRIPANRLYSTGLNILNWWPLPNMANVPAGQAYNYQVTQPAVKLLGWQPVVRVDYQPTQKLRGNFKYSQYQQPNTVIQGTIPGFNDTKEDDYGIYFASLVINYTVNNTTFVEGSWGRNTHHQEGCSITGGSPNYCTGALPVNPSANRITAGFGGIPYLFPNATILDPKTFSYEVVSRSNSPVWDGTRVQAAPAFSFGSRIANAPPNNSTPWNNFILDTVSGNTNVSLTKVHASHTLKAGYYYFKSLQRRGQGAFVGSISFSQDTVGTNPCDTSFGFANAAMGCFSQYSQLSRWGEGAYTAINHEAFVQDNWKVTRALTLDYGVRFVHQVPQYDGYLQNSNFLPETWKASAAPVLFVAGCANGVYPCSGTNRQAMNPTTNQFLGPNTSLAIGTLVPNSGNTTNGIFAAGQGIVNTSMKYPTVAAAPRVGAAWDVTGQQHFVVRGGVGLFFDRPQAQNLYNVVNNPPFARNVTVRYGQLQNLGSAGLTTEAPPSLTVWQYDEPLPSSTQWNLGMQMTLPFATAIDVSYTGQHSFHTPTGTNINSLDLGLAFLPQYQDLTQTPGASPVTTSVISLNQDVARFYRGYSTITQQQAIGWRTYHSIQVSLNRRFRNGLSFGFNDIMGLSDTQQSARRLQHNLDGTITLRADQAQADALLGDNTPQTHIMRANFVWQLPQLKSHQPTLRAIGLVVNDWSLSGIWSGATGAAYTISASYQNGGGNVNLTGSPDYGARIRVVGDPGKGCSSDIYRQFNAVAFQGPPVGSVGLESGVDYVKGCFSSTLDLSIARTIRLGGGRNVQLRVDMFNAPNQAGITNRITSLTLTSPSDPISAQNLPFDSSGALVVARSKPRGAGFGVATNYQSPRTVQAQARFSF